MNGMRTYANQILAVVLLHGILHCHQLLVLGYCCVTTGVDEHPYVRSQLTLTVKYNFRNLCFHIHSCQLPPAVIKESRTNSLAVFVDREQ